MWISPEFKVYLVQEFRRLKTDEATRESREWSFQRTLAKVNCRIHTDAIQAHLIPLALTKAQSQIVYASEADLLNAALFGKTAIEWRKENPQLEGNMRDHATLEQLVVLSNLESLNSVKIHENMLPVRWTMVADYGRFFLCKACLSLNLKRPVLPCWSKFSAPENL